MGELAEYQRRLYRFSRRLWAASYAFNRLQDALAGRESELEVVQSRATTNTQKALSMKNGAVSLAGTTYQRVHAAMIADIISGRLEPGARLKIGELAARYNVSQMPIREALQRLQGEGLVTLTPNHGASVRTFDEKLIADIYELRAELGGVVYRDFFASVTPEIIEQLETVQARYDLSAKKNDLKHCQIENINFHQIINSQCKNQEVIRVLNMQDMLVRHLRRIVGYSQARIQMQSTEHWEIINSIKAGDFQRTINAARAHGLGSGSDIIAHLREDTLKTMGKKVAAPAS